MRSTLTEEQVDYQGAVRDWLADVAPSDVVRGWLDAGDSATFEGRFAGDGMAGVGLAEELGGQGGGAVELALTAQELARAAAPSAGWLASVLAVPALAGRPDVVADVLAGHGAALLVGAEQVPDAAPAVRADPDGRLTGAVPRVLAGDTATRFVVPVTTPDGVALRLVDASHARVHPRQLLDRSRSAADVVLDDAPSDALDVDAVQVLADAASRGAVLVAADALGAMTRMLDLAVEYSGQRRQFGVPIGSFQAVKHAAATMLVGVEAARSVVALAAWSIDDADPRAGLHAAAAKAQVTAEGARAADSALTLHGAIGYTWEHDLQLFYKRAKLDEPLLGAPREWNERIAAGLALL